jgi:hypothetical protein
MNKKSQNDAINANHEPYHRKWHGGGCTHPLKNHGGGAFGITKKEWNRMIEKRNRDLKAKRKQLKK